MLKFDEFDEREIERLGKKLYQQAARKIIETLPECRDQIQQALEELLSPLKDPIEKMVYRIRGALECSSC